MSEIGDTPLNLSSYICGEPVGSDRELEVFYPYDGTLAGTVSLISPANLDCAIETALRGGEPLSRFARSEILEKARGLLLERVDQFAHKIAPAIAAGLRSWSNRPRKHR